MTETRICPSCNSRLLVMYTDVEYPADPPPPCLVCGTIFLQADDGQRWDSFQRRYYTSYRRWEYKMLRVLSRGPSTDEIAGAVQRVVICYDDATGVEPDSIAVLKTKEDTIRTAIAKARLSTQAHWSVVPSSIGGPRFRLTIGEYVAQFAADDLELPPDEFERLITEDKRNRSRSSVPWMRPSPSCQGASRSA